MIITHSSLECFNACRRKYKLRYIDGIAPKRSSDALVFGSAMHIALEAYWNHVKATQTFLTDDSDFGPCNLDFDANKVLTNKIDAAKLTGLLDGYTDKWFREDVETYDVISVEREFKVRRCGNDLTGKVDGIVRNKKTGKYYILEHKTASIVDESFVAQKQLDSQTKFYALMMTGVLGEKIDGAIHDILIKQKIRQKKGEPDEDFCERLKVDVTADNFQRIQIDFDYDKDIWEDYGNELDGRVTDLWNCRNFYKCTGSCIGRYGACEYMPLCLRGGLTEDIQGQYEVKRPHEEISEQTIGEAQQ